MKIIFDSKEEKQNFIKGLIDSKVCPDKLGLKEYCLPFADEKECRDCWDKAIRKSKRRKRTNYEKIHSMTPKEMAKILPCPHEVDVMPCMAKDIFPSNEMCHKCILEWLGRKAKSEDYIRYKK